MRPSSSDHTDAGWAPAGTNFVTIAASPPMRLTRKLATSLSGRRKVSMPAEMDWRTPHSPMMSPMLAWGMGSVPTCAAMEEMSAWLKR